MKARAMVADAVRNVVWREVAIPDPGPGQVLLRTIASGLSIGTELSVINGIRSVDAKFPHNTGYQGVGVVEELGEGVSELRKGERVLYLSSYVDSPVEGCSAHMDHIVTDVSDLIIMPDNLSSEEGALASMFSVGLNGVQLADVKAYDVVLVVGHGLIGAGSAQSCRARGAVVMVSEPHTERRALAEKYAADIVVDPASEDLAAVVRGAARPGKDGADVVIESTGINALVDGAFAHVRTHGKFVYQGYYAGDLTDSFHVPHGKEIFSFYPTGFGGPFWEGEKRIAQKRMKAATVRLLARGAMTLKPYLSHVLPLDQAMEGWKLAMSDKRDTIMGMVFRWSEGF